MGGTIDSGAVDTIRKYIITGFKLFFYFILVILF